MAINKKEKKLIIILGVLVYLFAFVKFVVMSSVPKISEAGVRLEEAKERKRALDRDLKNLAAYQAELDTKTIINERLGAYLMDSAVLADSIVFVEKLAMLMDTAVERVSLGQPAEMTEKGGTKYYGFPVGFDACMPYEKLKEILRYCEGGAKKVRVDGFTIKPATDEQLSKSAGKAPDGEQLFSVSMKLVFYSLDKNAANDLARFSRSRYQEFKGRDGMPIFIEDDADLSDDDLPKRQTAVPSEKPESAADSAGKITRGNADFIVFSRGYLYAGYNFETYASFNSKERIRRKTAGKMDVLLALDNESYTIQSTDAEGNTQSVSGSLPDRNLTLHVKSDIDDRVKENEGLQVNVTVRNNTGRSIRVQVDKLADRVKLLDRDGNEIQTKNDREKVYL